jgi:hypothetical protein
VAEFLRNQFNPSAEPERTAIRRLWSRVPARENYYLKQAEYGEIAGAYGLALLVVAETATTPKKSGLLVFIRRPRNRYDSYWIYRDEDFAKIEMSRASGNIFVRGARQDGTTIDCTIGWSRRDNKWTCLSF